jgi:hypothetical protein
MHRCMTHGLTSTLSCIFLTLGVQLVQTDNLPRAEQMLVAPYVTSTWGAYIAPPARRAASPSPRAAVRPQVQGRLLYPATVAANAAARNLPVSVVPYRAPPLPSDAPDRAFFDAAQRSLHSIPAYTQWSTPDPVQGLVSSPAATAQFKARRETTAKATYAPTQSLAEQPSPAPGQVMRNMRMHRIEGAKLAQLPEAPSIAEVASGGQAFIDRLEKKLADTQQRVRVERQVVHAINNPNAVFLPAGNAANDKEGVEFSQRPGVMFNVPGVHGALQYNGVAEPTAPVQTMQGVAYPSYTANPYDTIYGRFANYGPMQRWAAEDSAEHAYTLSKWRENILRARIEQAKLRKELMDANNGFPAESTPAAASAASSTPQLSTRPQGGQSLRAVPKGPSAVGLSGGAGAAVGGKPAAEAAMAQEIGALKSTLAKVAEETADSLVELRRKVDRLRARREETAPPRGPAGRRSERGRRGGQEVRDAATQKSGSGAGGAHKARRDAALKRLRGKVLSTIDKVEGVVESAIRHREAERRARVRELSKHVDFAVRVSHKAVDKLQAQLTADKRALKMSESSLG